MLLVSVGCGVGMAAVSEWWAGGVGMIGGFMASRDGVGQRD